MTHIPFQHSYVKGGSACYIEREQTTVTGPPETAALGSTTVSGSSLGATPTLSYSDASLAGSTESFASDTTCSEDSEMDGTNEIDFLDDTPPSSDSTQYHEVRR